MLFGDTMSLVDWDEYFDCENIAQYPCGAAAIFGNDPNGNYHYNGVVVKTGEVLLTLEGQTFKNGHVYLNDDTWIDADHYRQFGVVLIRGEYTPGSGYGTGAPEDRNRPHYRSANP